MDTVIILKYDSFIKKSFRKRMINEASGIECEKKVKSVTANTFRLTADFI